MQCFGIRLYPGRDPLGDENRYVIDPGPDSQCSESVCVLNCFHRGGGAPGGYVCRCQSITSGLGMLRADGTVTRDRPITTARAGCRYVPNCRHLTFGGRKWVSFLHAIHANCLECLHRLLQLEIAE